jgi:hypothetical protein
MPNNSLAPGRNVVLIADVSRSIVRVDRRRKESFFLVSAHLVVKDGIAG